MDFKVIIFKRNIVLEVAVQSIGFFNKNGFNFGICFEVKRILTKEEKTAIADIKAMLENHPEIIKDTFAFVLEKVNNQNN